MDNPSTVFDLSPPEKMQLVEDLWDDLSSEVESVPVRDWHKEKLDDRKNSLEKNPESTMSWPEIKATVKNQNDR